MALVSIHRGEISTVYEIGTQYIESGATLTLGNPNNVDMSSVLFSTPGIYIIFKIDSGATFNSATVNQIDVTATYPGRSVVQQGGNDAYWDAATSTVRVRIQ